MYNFFSGFFYVVSFMASKLPRSTLSLKQFLKRQEVLQLYRDCLKTIYKIDDPVDKKYFLNWARDEFQKFKRETSEESINYHIARGKKSLKDLSTALRLSK